MEDGASTSSATFGRWELGVRSWKMEDGRWCFDKLSNLWELEDGSLETSGLET
ncbi:MAG: hypothetical protein QM535_16525 [Limnohabitans sp.]|nr:hypothetical protein [Limnohabitans sp.]